MLVLVSCSCKATAMHFARSAKCAGDVALSAGIESYRFGRIVIDGQVHTKDVVILPGRVIGGWWRKEGHALHVEDLAAIFEAAPHVLVVGRGVYGLMKVTEKAQRALEQAGIELVALPTGKAVEAYNRLRGERTVAAALHLTC
jgi:hypothetical protein